MRSSNVSNIATPNSATNACSDVSGNTDSISSTDAGDPQQIPVDVEAGIRQPSEILWMYYDDDGMPHNSDPWSPCDASLSSKIEAAYQSDPTASVIVENETWRYQVDLKTMTQTNLDHPAHRCRSLRRVELA